MPPRVLATRAVAEARAHADRRLEPRVVRRFDVHALLHATGFATVDALWSSLAARPYAADTSTRSPTPEPAVEARARSAMSRRVDLLGSGVVELGRPIDWSCDFKSGRRWPLSYARDIEYTELGKPSDVKVPWELSRMQWLVPVGQLHLARRDEETAEFVREVLEEWLDANPYAHGVNWACTMDVALRLVTWTWLFHVFAHSGAWQAAEFRERFLTSLFLHARFTERNLELSDINGNHLTADAAGLMFAGEFFGHGRQAARWASRGWRLLLDELPRQVYEDGVDFEASTAYHRLVTELFLLPALYRMRLGHEVPAAYRDRVLSMARFAGAYNRDGLGAPVWGDADDARVLPFGPQPPHDHGYLPGIVGLAFGAADVTALHAGHADEAYWLLGEAIAAELPQQPAPRASAAFRGGGVYILRGDGDHVFVDCGPVGLGGRGGHGHNDCLSFEAALCGVRLFVDPGSYAYTSSVEWRNRFRSTAFHNTPRVDDEEQNRFISPTSLWHLHYDARPHELEWFVDDDASLFRGSHDGYLRLADPVTPTRTVVLGAVAHRLAIHDEFAAGSSHTFAVPLHLAPDVAAEITADRIVLSSGEARFDLVWRGDWHPELRPTWVAPSYGIKHESTCIEFTRRGTASPLLIVVAPAGDRGDVMAWVDDVLARNP